MALPNLLSNRNYTKVELRVIDLATAFKNGSTMMEFINNKAVYTFSKEKGYPLNVIMDALAFIISSKTGNLNGKRPKGNRDEIIEKALKENSNFSVTFEIPDLLTPIILTDSKHSAMVSPMNATVYKKLISFSEDNENKMKIRTITEEDLR